MIRSVLAVVAGYAAMAIAVMLLFVIVLYSPEHQPGVAFMLGAIAFAFLAAILGGFVAALVARRAPMRHALGLAGLCVSMWIVSAIGSSGKEPLWFQVCNLVVMLAGVLAGGYLRARQGKSKAELA